LRVSQGVGGGNGGGLRYNSGVELYSVNTLKLTASAGDITLTPSTAIVNIAKPAGLLQINGTQVLTVRQAAIPDTTGATLPTVEGEVNKLKAMCRVHGLIS
jgi:hypothetical protein